MTTNLLTWPRRALLAAAVLAAAPVAADVLSLTGPTLVTRGETVMDGPAESLLILPDGRVTSCSRILSGYSGGPLAVGDLLVHDLQTNATQRLDAAGGLRTPHLDENPVPFDACVHDPAVGDMFLAFAVYAATQPAPPSTLAQALAKPGVIALAGSPVPCERVLVVGLAGGATQPPDTTPPVLRLPANIALTTDNFAGALVTYAASATDDRDGSVPVSCVPASGSLFPRGSTSVSCRAQDAAGNLASGSFLVGITSFRRGDVDVDGDIDRDDLNLVVAARNRSASGPNDPRDVDGDGSITVLDARKLVLLCTRANCATQ